MQDQVQKPDGRNGKIKKTGVLLPLPLPPLDYQVDGDINATRGLLVNAPLGGRLRTGAVWGEASGAIDEKKLKPINPLPGRPRLPVALCDFIDWVADYTVFPTGQVLAMALRASDALKAEKPRPAFTKGEKKPEPLTRARARVLKVAGDGLSRSAADLAREAAVSVSVIDGLAAAHALNRVELPELLQVVAVVGEIEGERTREVPADQPGQKHL